MSTLYEHYEEFTPAEREQYRKYKDFYNEMDEEWGEEVDVYAILKEHAKTGFVPSNER